VLACPAYQQAAILADLDAELADHIGAIPYNRVTVVALGFRRADVPRSLDGFGYITPQRLRRDVLGVQWCSSIFAGRAPEGMVLLRAMVGGWHRAEVAGWDDARLIAVVRDDLRAALGIQIAPIFQHIARWDRAIPQYHVGHLERVGWIEARAARHPGLFLTGNAYKGVALNDCTEQAELLAVRIKNVLASQGQ
jgi:oxygen-dependent protoporphyrinogen oxidase